MSARTTPRRATAASIGCALAVALAVGPPANASPGGDPEIVPAARTALSTSGAVLSLTGAPLVHTFDTTTPGDSVEGVWTLTNTGTQAASYDGLLAPVGQFSLDLAQNLVVEYGIVGADDQVTGWAAAGTLAQPVSYTTALGTVCPAVSGNDRLVIPVRVTLADPGALTSAPGDEQTVGATFSISYLSPGDDTSTGGSGAGCETPGGGDQTPGSGAGNGAGGGPGQAAGPGTTVSSVLASTGAQVAGLLLVAFAAVAAGGFLRRRRRTT